MPSYQQFCETLYGIAASRLTPSLLNSQYAYARILRQALAGQGRWLDLGCGHGFFPSWVRERPLDLASWQPVGVDMDASSIRRHTRLRWRVNGDIQRLPFADGSFNLVTANMVLEHVANPPSLFAEIGRVLRKDGLAIVHTPNVDGYTTVLARLLPDKLLAPFAALLLGRENKDVYPTFYRANSEAALRSATEGSGIHVTDIRYVESSPQFIRIPPLMALELAAIRFLRRPTQAHRRVCLIASFTK
jgi:SAM-dependent methyltransferase